MITIRLSGGMGNQMFQYAFGKARAAALKTDMKIDCSLLLDRARGKDFVYRDYDLSIFQVEEQFTVAPSLLRTLFRLKSSTVGKQVRRFLARGKNYEKEQHFHVDQRLVDTPSDNTIYEGWWQSEKYFTEIHEVVRKDFQLKQPLLPASKELHARIENSTAVCLNVRRTDFLANAALNATNLDYFLRAASKMATLVNNPHFFVFSDDVEWCQENIVLEHPMEVVQHTMKGHKFGNYFRLMRDCKHFIIPNSSFAWWAAWLCEHPNKKVIAPAQWFNEGDYNTNDVVPNDWMRL